MQEQNDFISSLTRFAALLPLLIVTPFILGFLIWNFFLSRLGFLEDNLIQAKFIPAGITFLFLFFIGVIVYIQLRRRIFLKRIESIVLKEFGSPVFRVLISFEIILLMVMIYSRTIFPFIPGNLGGGYPRVLSLIMEENEIQFWDRFGLNRGEGSSSQTINLCIIYENNEHLIITKEDRILAIKKDYIKGFGSLPKTEFRVLKSWCRDQLLFWLWS